MFIRIEDDDGKELLEKGVYNNLEEILESVRPHGEEARFVLESTGNWYWLVDGLRAAGHEDVKLANALELRAISGVKVKTDPRDARKLAKLLRMGEIPAAYAYPAGKREVRDLLRHRIRLVQRRSGCDLMLRSTLRKYNVHGDLSTNGLKRLKEEEVDCLTELSRIDDRVI